VLIKGSTLIKYLLILKKLTMLLGPYLVTLVSHQILLRHPLLPLIDYLRQALLNLLTRTLVVLRPIPSLIPFLTTSLLSLIINRVFINYLPLVFFLITSSLNRIYAR
jgi:hypothetical protein